MAKNRLTLDFQGLDQIMKQLNYLEKSVKPVTERALRKSHKIVTDAARKAARKHVMTGKMYNSLRGAPDIEWTGPIVEDKVGFDIGPDGTHGGLPSIFLMYGTPRVNKDQAMYDAFYGRKIINQVKKAQEKVFSEAIKKAAEVKA